MHYTSKTDMSTEQLPLDGTVRLQNRATDENASCTLSGKIIGELINNKPASPIISASAKSAEPITYEKFYKYYIGKFTKDFGIHFMIDKKMDISVINLSECNPIRGSRPASSADACRMFACLTWYISLFPQAIRKILGTQAMMDFYRSSPYPLIRLDSGEIGTPEDILREAGLLPTTSITRRKFMRSIRTTMRFIEDELIGVLHQDENILPEDPASCSEVARAKLIRSAEGHISEILRFCTERTVEFCLDLEDNWQIESLNTLIV